jgi:putative transposase
MNTPATTNLYKRHRLPAEIISHSVWLYYRFSLSYRDVEELMAERGVTMSHEAVRYWCRKFGQTYANRLRRRRPRPGDKWHLDEVFLTIKKERHYLWRAVDQDGHVLDILMQRRRDKHAAKKFFRKLLKGLTYVPRVISTDQLASYSAAKREILPSVEHRQHRYLSTGTDDAAVQVCWSGPTLPLSPRSHPVTLPSWTLSAQDPSLSSGDGIQTSSLARDHRNRDRGLRVKTTAL